MALAQSVKQKPEFTLVIFLVLRDLEMVSIVPTDINSTFHLCKLKSLIIVMIIITQLPAVATVKCTKCKSDINVQRKTLRASTLPKKIENENSRRSFVSC